MMNSNEVANQVAQAEVRERTQDIVEPEKPSKLRRIAINLGVMAVGAGLFIEGVSDITTSDLGSIKEVVEIIGGAVVFSFGTVMLADGISRQAG